MCSSLIETRAQVGDALRALESASLLFGETRPFVPVRPALSRSGGCTVAVRDLTPQRARSRNARKRQQNAEGVGFEPT